jgi:hypothetical protein
MPHVAAGLLLFVGTIGTNPMITWYICAFAVALGVWQLWMRRARLWWTWVMSASVLLYWLAWAQPFPLVLLLAGIFVIVAVVPVDARRPGGVAYPVAVTSPGRPGEAAAIAAGDLVCRRGVTARRVQHELRRDSL